MASNADENLRSVVDTKVQLIKQEGDEEEYEIVDEFYPISDQDYETTTFINDEFDDEGEDYEKLELDRSKRQSKVPKKLSYKDRESMLSGKVGTRQPAKNPKPRIYTCTFENCGKSFESPSKLARYIF